MVFRAHLVQVLAHQVVEQCFDLSLKSDGMGSKYCELEDSKVSEIDAAFTFIKHHLREA